MASEQELRGALEAIDRILNLGGDADDVLREVVRVLHDLYSYVAISFVEGDELLLGPWLGARDPERQGRSFPVSFQGTRVAELYLEFPAKDEEPLLERAALLISPHCLVGWDTGGEPWPEAG